MINDQIMTALATVALAVVGVATLSVIVSKNANTTGVLNALSGGLAQDLGAAEAPVTGSGSGSFGGFSNYSSPSFGINGSI